RLPGSSTTAATLRGSEGLPSGPPALARTPGAAAAPRPRAGPTGPPGRPLGCPLGAVGSPSPRPRPRPPPRPPPPATTSPRRGPASDARHAPPGGATPWTLHPPRVGHPGGLPLPAAALGHLEALLNPRPVGVPARVGGARRQVRQQQPRLVVAGLPAGQQQALQRVGAGL